MNRTVLVTGGSRGIGRACALYCAQMGCRVAVGYHTRAQEAAETVRQIEEAGGEAAAFLADVADQAQVEAMVQAVYDRFSRIDYLINNAGIAQQKLFLDITPQEWDRMFAVDVRGMFLTCKAVLPRMIAEQAGAIVNISSMWGLTGASCEVHYSAAKAAVIGLTKALAKEMGPSGIRVNCIAPGVINTEMNGALPAEVMQGLAEETPLCRIGTPAEVARAAWFLLSAEASFVTGQVLSVDGGFAV